MNQQPETCLRRFVAVLFKHHASWTNQDSALEYVSNLALAVFPGWTSQLPAAMQGASLPWQSIWGKLPCYIETKSRFKGWQIPDAWGDNFTQLVDLTFDSFLIFFPHLFLRHHATSTWYSRIFRSIWVKYYILPTNGHFHDSPTKPPSGGSAEVAINQP